MSVRAYIIVGIDCDEKRTPEGWVEELRERLKDAEKYNPNITLGDTFETDEIDFEMEDK